MVTSQIDGTGATVVSVRRVVVLVMCCSILSFAIGAGAVLILSPRTTPVALPTIAGKNDPKARVEALLKQQDALRAEIELAVEQYNKSAEASKSAE